MFALACVSSIISTNKSGARILHFFLKIALAYTHKGSSNAVEKKTEREVGDTQAARLAHHISNFISINYRHQKSRISKQNIHKRARHNTKNTPRLHADLEVFSLAVPEQNNRSSLIQEYKTSGPEDQTLDLC